MCRRRIKTGLGIDQKLFRKEYSLDPGSLQILPQKQPGPDLSDSEFDLNKKGKKISKILFITWKTSFFGHFDLQYHFFYNKWMRIAFLTSWHIDGIYSVKSLKERRSILFYELNEILHHMTNLDSWKILGTSQIFFLFYSEIHKWRFFGDFWPRVTSYNLDISFYEKLMQRASFWYMICRLSFNFEIWP